MVNTTMKKKYEAPAMEIIRIEPTQMLAASGKEERSIRLYGDDDDYDDIL